MKKVPPCCSFPIEGDTLRKMKGFYAPFQEKSPNEYVDLFARGEGFVVQIYKPNSKGEVKALFQGPSALTEARIWNSAIVDSSVQPAPKKPLLPPLHPITVLLNRYPQIGSDEVGTGDFFGPICVCASYVEEKDLPRINELKIVDSKKMEDDYILSIGPTLIKEFSYSQISLPNEKYNEIHDEFNMNAIKAKMHNRCDLNLLGRFPHAYLYQDQFAEESLYYHYLQNEKKVARGITFHVKGESLYPSVALASVIARYSFLRKMEELSNKYGIEIPFGANDGTTSFAQTFKEKYGLDELNKIVKKNFANYRKII